jgi:hypothetical protein
MAEDGAPNRRAVLLGGVAAAPFALSGSTSAAEHNEEFQSNLPRCTRMDGSGLRIVPSYTEGGWFSEANCVTISDGERTALYVPAKIGGQASSPDESKSGGPLSDAERLAILSEGVRRAHEVLLHYIDPGNGVAAADALNGFIEIFDSAELVTAAGVSLSAEPL